MNKYLFPSLLNHWLIKIIESCREAIPPDLLTCLLAEPHNPKLLNELGNYLQLAGHFEDAEVVYMHVIKFDPEYLHPYRNLAILYHQQDRTAEAIEGYQRYLALAPEDGEAFFNLGLLYMEQVEHAAAMAGFEAATRYLVLKDIETATQLGVAWFFLEDLEMAELVLTDALTLDPAYLPARYHLALVNLYQREYTQAIELLEGVLEEEPLYPQAASNLGVAYLSGGMPQKALPIFERLVKQEPENPSHTLNLGLTYQDLHQAEAARACLETVPAHKMASFSQIEQALQALSELHSA